MADPAFYLTPADKAKLKDIIDRVEKLEANYGRATRPEDDHQAPESYVALCPDEDIPARVGDVPGSNICDIYAIRKREYDPTLEVISKQALVFNVFNEAVPANEYVPVTRDKFGAWLTVSIPSGTTTTTTTSTTTTQPPTTTPAPCTGSCLWDYNFTTKKYSFVSSTCSTGCDCLPPMFIPVQTWACTTARVRTDCGRTGGTSGQPPSCSTTTSTSTTAGPTTTVGPNCTGCKWAWGFPGWYRIETETWNCDACVGCATPTSTPTSPVTACDPVFTPCSPPPPPPPPPFCVGDCRWVGLLNNTWRLQNYNCSSLGVSNCYCDAPAHVPVCAEEALTPCYVHGSSTTLPPNTNLCTTTLPPWGSCNGGCMWQWLTPPTVATAAWSKVYHGCPGCDCPTPSTDGAASCEMRQTACTVPTTTPPPTTSTTTTSTTTLPGTTTTPAPCQCQWGEGYVKGVTGSCGIPADGLWHKNYINYQGGPCVDGYLGCFQDPCSEYLMLQWYYYGLPDNVVDLPGSNHSGCTAWSYGVGSCHQDLSTDYLTANRVCWQTCTAPCCGLTTTTTGPLPSTTAVSPPAPPPTPPPTPPVTPPVSPPPAPPVSPPVGPPPVGPPVGGGGV